ncbi:MAG: hypothetical protein DWH79_11320 [Planctomycetota bacterium]|nr:MAG: hypothetical protein DWH79_11320 [Planctomycetota bacterium]
MLIRTLRGQGDGDDDAGGRKVSEEQIPAKVEAWNQGLKPSATILQKRSLTDFYLAIGEILSGFQAVANFGHQVEETRSCRERWRSMPARRLLAGSG